MINFRLDDIILENLQIQEISNELAIKIDKVINP